MLSKEIKIDNIKSVCLTLGPYRNLTTLTAAIIFLHPTCQVLNHAGMRIFEIEELNFLLNYTPSKFDAFSKYAIYISAGGRQGEWGGSITLSHAFDHEEIRKKYQERYGNSLMKEKVECLFWKESLRTSNLIKQFNVDLREIFKQNDKLKFLLPVRNPLDCTASNIRTGHMLLFPSINNNSSFNKVLESVFKEILWFFNLQNKHPERFFTFFENSFDENLLLGLASFLNIYPDKQWIKTALSNFKIKKIYKHSVERTDYYKELLKQYSSDYPEVIKKLSNFV